MLRRMKGNPTIAIVGAGNLGSALARTLAEAGFRLESIVAHDRRKSWRKARALARQVKTRAVVSPENVRAEVVWFCVPDSEIAKAAQHFVGGMWKGRIALHSSGALTSDELDSLRQEGAHVASVHPLMTFVRGSIPSFTGVPFAIEGDGAAVRAARVVVKKLRGQAYPIRKQDKAAYHAWGTFASPLLTALLATTEEVAKLAGISEEAARRRMIPILSRTLANYGEVGAKRGFSGPIIRGDVETVRQHLRVLRRVPEGREVYIALARAALHFLPGKRKAAMRRVLARGNGSTHHP